MKKNWLNGKTVIVTGASSGFGKIFVKKLINDFNCTVIGIARNKEKMEVLSSELNSKNFSYHLFDVSEKENWKSFVSLLINQKINVDVLINNAGIMPPFSKFEAYSEKEIESTINTNFMSNVYAIKELLPIIKKSNSPCIINVSSAAGYVPIVGTSLYCSSKSALRFFTESLQEEYRNQIYVAGIYPGFAKTDLFVRHNLDEKSSKIIDIIATDAEKAVSIMIRKIKRKKKRIIIGKDAKLLRLLYLFFPKSSNKIINFFFKKSKLKLFENLYK